MTLLAVGWGCGPTTAATLTPTAATYVTSTPTPPSAHTLYATSDLPSELQSEARSWAEGHSLTYGSGPSSGLTPSRIADGLAFVVSLHTAEWASEPAFIEAGVRGVVVDPPAPVSSSSVSEVVADRGSWEEAGFLAGLLTGLIGDSRAGGSIASGEDSQEAGALTAGFNQGMRYACPRCEVIRQDVSSLDVGEFARQGVGGVFVAPGDGAAEAAVAAAAAGLWIVWIGDVPPEVPTESLAAAVRFDPAALLEDALDALSAGGEGQTWPYSVRSSSLVVARIDAQAISPGKQRLLEQALAKLASAELQLIEP